jgi:RNA polymerase sigma-70 factor (ECF subfamily)
MNAMIEPENGEVDELALTLGSLLYHNGHAIIPESEWIGLVAATAHKDTSAFGDLYMRTHGIVFALLFRITRDRVLAEELTVESFHEVWRSAPTYEPALGTVVAWIMNLARTRAVARMKAGASPE